MSPISRVLVMVGAITFGALLASCASDLPDPVDPRDEHEAVIGPTVTTLPTMDEIEEDMRRQREYFDKLVDAERRRREAEREERPPGPVTLDDEFKKLDDKFAKLQLLRRRREAIRQERPPGLATLDDEIKKLHDEIKKQLREMRRRREPDKVWKD